MPTAHHPIPARQVPEGQWRCAECRARGDAPHNPPRHILGHGAPKKRPSLGVSSPRSPGAPSLLSSHDGRSRQISPGLGDISLLTVHQLKDQLRARGLDTSGVLDKSELVARLVAARASRQLFASREFEREGHWSRSILLQLV